MRRRFALFAVARLLATMAGAMLSGGAAAGWVGWCAEAPSVVTDGTQKDFLLPEGERRWLVFSVAAPAGCTGTSVPIDPSDLAAVAIAPDSTALGYVLTGQFAPSGTATISEVAPLESPPGAREMNDVPLHRNLLPQLQSHPFGAPRTALKRVGEALEVTCTAGSPLAGVLLESKAGLPRGVGLSMELGYEGGGLELAVSDAARLRREEPLPLGSLNTVAAGRHSFNIPDAIARGEAWGITLVCPAAGGKVLVRSLQLTTGLSVAARDRATWVWDSSQWQSGSETLLRLARQHRVTTLFISVRVDAAGEVRDGQSLRRFVAAARRQGVAVWAVEGDPRAVLPEERQKFVARTAAIRRWNERQPPGMQLAGMQYDIEPYVLPGYQLDPAGWHAAYLDTLKALKSAAGMPVDVVLPFWWADAKVGKSRLLDTLAPIVETVTVMDYRTDPVQIRQFALPFLEWGRVNDKRVRIALEAGRIEDEQMRVFRPAPRGTLLKVRVQGQWVLLMSRRVMESADGELFEETQSGVSKGNTISFYHDKPALIRLVPVLERHWRSYPAFGGVAIHELF